MSHWRPAYLTILDSLFLCISEELSVFILELWVKNISGSLAQKSQGQQKQTTKLLNDPEFMVPQHSKLNKVSE
jgi:hypothetical protein